jgi:uncharacterized protein
VKSAEILIFVFRPNGMPNAFSGDLCSGRDADGFGFKCLLPLNLGVLCSNLLVSINVREVPMSNSKSPEEEYFYKMNKELIEQNRARLDSERKEREAAQKKTQHWMRCPKCGDSMSEMEMTGIMVDKCKSCGGIYFDSGELELFLKSNKPEGLFDSLKKKLF